MGRRTGLMLLLFCFLVAALWSTGTEASPLATGNIDYPAIANHRDFRSRRGLKNTGQLATARGFGKRSSLPPFSSNNDDQDDLFTEETEENYPIDWLVEYIEKKPSLLRYLVERIFDRNGDGQLSSSEILNVLRD